MMAKKKRIIPTHVRRRNREIACQVAERLETEVHRVRINDDKAAHVSIWVDENRRVEWWPGPMHWRDWSGKKHRGSPLAFAKFVRAAVAQTAEAV